MRKPSFIATVSLIILVFYTACHKTDNSGPYISATINGQYFSSSNCVCNLDTIYYSTGGSGIAMVISGAQYHPPGSYKLDTVIMFRFSIYGYTGPGTYPFFTGPSYHPSGCAQATYQTSDYSMLDAVDGFVTITATLPEVVGTFSFTAFDYITFDSIKIENGKFAAKFLGQ